MAKLKARAQSSDRVSDEYLEVNACGIERIYRKKQGKPRGSNRPNGRSDYHILYVEKGVCHLFLDGAWQELGEGSVVLFRPLEAQKYYYSGDENAVSHYIHFSGVGCEHILKKLGIYGVKVFFMGKSASYEKLSEQMAREFGMRKPMYKELCAACLYQILSLLGRKYALRQSNVNKKSESRINAACREIYENLGDPPSASKLAADCCLSTSRFLHLFKEVTDKSYTEFVAALRIEKAKETLVFTDLPVREVAALVGYEDQNYFSRCFRRIVGCSPAKYRRDEK